MGHVAGAQGVGFVTCVAGRPRDRQETSDADQLFASVLRLRRLGNHDPVIAYHVDQELSEEEAQKLSKPAVAPLQLVDATTIASRSDLNATRGKMRLFRSYYCLVFAVLHSPFEGTMLMNADTLFVADPTRWWQLPAVQATGVLFFEDKFSSHLWTPAAQHISVCNEMRALAKTFGYPLRQNFEVDYGAFCSGKRRHLLECSLTMFNKSHVRVSALLNVLRDLLWHVFDPSRSKSFHVPLWGYGDKELYWIASELAGYKPYFSPRGSPAAVGPKLGPRKRATCFVHLEPGTSKNRRDSSKISHLNMAHDCGWSDKELSWHFSASAPLWDTPTSQVQLRMITPEEASILSAFIHDAYSSFLHKT